jgi:hypothetical protein
MRERREAGDSPAGEADTSPPPWFGGYAALAEGAWMASPQASEVLESRCPCAGGRAVYFPVSPRPRSPGC